MEPIVRAGIRLPSSSPRGSREKFAKLLSSVDPDAQCGFGFEGCFYKPGKVCTDAELRPTLDFPAMPIVLEFMKGPSYGIPGHKRSDAIYILWRLENDVWRELGRAVSHSWEWATELRPLAVRALREARGGALVRVMPDLVAVAGRIRAVLDLELRLLELPERMQVVGILHDQFAVRMCA